MGDSADGGRPGDTIRGEVDADRVSDWFLLNGDRRLAALVVAAAFFGGLAVAGRFAPVSIRTLVANESVLWWVFSPMIGAIVTGVTLVITINQLILSEELVSLGDKRDRMERSIEFRMDVEARLDDPVSPADPALFMYDLLDAVRDRTDELDAAVDDTPDDDLHQEVNDYVDGVRDDAEQVVDMLDDAMFGQFDVLFDTLHFNYSWKIHQGRRIMKRHEDALTPEAGELLDEIVELLGFFGPAREHVKTLYFQWTLVDLSRVMLLSSVPALFVAVAVQLFVDGSSFPGATLGVEHLTWALAGFVTFTLLPFFLLLTYVIRVATVTKRTLAIGPFVLRNTDRSTIEWD